jgi:hypothetical protein
VTESYCFACGLLRRRKYDGLQLELAELYRKCTQSLTFGTEG